MTSTHHPDEAPQASTAQPPKPLLRGWIHLFMAPIALIVGLALTALAPDIDVRLASAIYTLSAVVLFGTSATYHRGTWKVKTLAAFRRFDHSNIFLFIAGTYTPLAVSLLSGSARWSLLALIWTLAFFGVAFRLLWLSAPRWLYTIMYIAMGWAAIGWLPQMWQSGGPTVVLLIILGGVIYSLGAVSYATKWPKLNPRWFGFHEIFHTATALAATAHVVAIWLAAFT